MNNKVYILLGLIFCLSGLVLIFLSKKDFTISSKQIVENTQDTIIKDAFRQPETIIEVSIPIDSTLTNKKEDSTLVLNLNDGELDLNLEYNYLVVVGSFKVEENAIKLVEELKIMGFNSSFIYEDDNNYTYAVIDSYTSRSDAKKSLIISKLDGWVKKK